MDNYINETGLSKLSSIIKAKINASIKVVADELNLLKNKVKDIELFKFPNANIIGSPLITNGQISGFTNSDYLTFPFIVDVKNRRFEIDFCFTTSDNVTTQQNILDSKFGIALAIKDGHGLMALSSDGQSFNIGSISGTYNIAKNTTYYAKVTWDGSVYKTAISVDGETYVDDMVLNNTNMPYPTTIYIGGSPDLFGVGTAHPFNGIINFNKSQLKIEDLVVWQGMDDAGLATRADVSLENLDEKGEKRFSDIHSNIGNLYSESSVYSVGDFAIYDNILYKCKNAITTPKKWDISDWERANTSSEISNLKEDLTQVSESITEIDGLQISTEEVSKGKLSDATVVAENEPFYGYSVPIKNIANIRKVVINGIYVKGNSSASVDCLLEFLNENKEVMSYKSISLKSGSSATFNENVEFVFNSPVDIPVGYMRISCPVAISYIDNRNKNMGNMFDGASRVGQFLQTYGGNWTNLTASQTLQFSLNAEFYSVAETRKSKINLITNNAVIKYVKSASELVEALAEAEENAKENQWYNIHVASGEYNLLPFIDLDSITKVTATGYRGIEVPRYTRLIGDKASRPHIYVDLTEVATTTEQQWTVSTLNMTNDAELYNLVVTGMQCRYAVHDDGGNAPYVRYCENCTFVHYQNTAGIVWSQQTAYGNGTYKGCRETFKDCEFIAYHESLYIHDNPTYNVDSEIILDNCRFESTNKPQSVKFQSMGASATTTIKIKDSSFNKPIKKQIDNASKDSMTITGWKNTIDTDLGVTIE